MKKILSLFTLTFCTSLFAQLPVIQLQSASSGNSLLNGLAAAWSFDENVARGNRTDTVNGYVLQDLQSGTLQVGSVRGMMCGAASITNTTCWLSNSANASVFRAGSGVSFTLAVWTVGANANNSRIGSFKINGGFAYDWVLVGGAFQAIGNVTGNTYQINNPSVANDNNWVLSIVGFDAATSKMFFSQNGGTYATANVTGSGDSFIPNNSYPFFNNWINGASDELYFWNRALTQAEATRLYNSGYGLKYPFSANDPAEQITSAWSFQVTNDGGYVTPQNWTTVKTFTQGLITDSIWSKFNCIITYCPDTLQSALVPLKTTWLQAPGNDITSPAFDPYSTKVGFVSGDLSVNGLKGETTAANATKYTEFRANNVIAYSPTIWPSINDSSWSIYCAEAGLEANGFQFGVYDNGVAGNPSALLRVNSFGSGPHAILGDEAASADTNTAIAGYYSCNRASSTDLKLFIGSTVLPHGLYASTNRANANATFRGVQSIINALHIISAGFYYGSSNAVSYLSTGTHLIESESLAQFNRATAMRVGFGGGFASPFTSTPSNSVVLFGNNKALVGAAAGASAYQWKKNGSTIGGATQSSYAITGAALSDFGNYQLVATVSGTDYPSPTVQLATVTTTTVSNWVVQVAVNGAANMSSNTIYGVDQFWNGCLTDSLDSDLITVNCMVPDSLLACVTPLVVGAGGNKLWTTNSFVSSDLTVDGLKGDLSNNKWLDTGVIPSATAMSTSSAGGSAYIHTQSTGNSAAWGAFNTGPVSIVGLFPDTSTTSNLIFYCYGFGGTVLTTNSARTNGFYSVSRTASNLSTAYFANSQYATASLGDATGTDANGVTTALSMQVFNLSYNGGPHVWSSDARISFVDFHTGINLTKTGNLFNRVQTMRTTFGGGFR